MDVRTLFRTCRREMREIIIMKERRDTITAALLPRAIQYRHDNIRTTPEDHFTKAMARVADLDEDINRKLAGMMKRQQEAQKIIDDLEDSRYRQVLMLYYLTFRGVSRGGSRVLMLHNWRSVGKALDYSEDHVKRLHNEALQKIKDDTK